MSNDKVEKILSKLREKLLKKEVPDNATVKIILNLQSGGVSGETKLELTI
jgi:hypothetical protein